jgi:hypothetical protein
MAEVKVLFWRGSGWIARQIQVATKAPWTHVAVFIRWPDEPHGWTYEFDAWGARRTLGQKDCTTVKIPIRSMEFFEVYELERYWLGVIRWHNVYAFWTLFALLAILPTRWLWERLGFRPFSAKWWGRVCSAGVAESFKKACIDLVPKRAEVYETPKEVFNSWFLKEST